MSGHSPAILLVDDDEDSCQNMADIFDDLGYSVDVAHDGRTAIELVRGRKYDVALLDLKMPGMDGLALYREIKKTQAGMVTFLITAYANDSTAAAATSAGMWQILSKPVDLPQLLPLIDEALGRPLILLVDDADDLRVNLWDLLRAQGYRVCIAHDGLEALERVRHSTCVVLIDREISDASGDVSRKIREANPEARIVIISGRPADLESKLKSMMADEVDAICTRPLDIPGLLGTLERLAGHAGPRRSSGPNAGKVGER